MLGHKTHDAIERLYRRIQTIRKKRREELTRQLEQLQLAFQEQQQALEHAKVPPAPPHQHHHKPKKEAFYTKQQRRQQQKLKHLQEDVERQKIGDSTPKLHHRAWSALPVEGNVWHHSLEEEQELV